MVLADSYLEDLGSSNLSTHSIVDEKSFLVSCWSTASSADISIHLIISALLVSSPVTLLCFSFLGGNFFKNFFSSRWIEATAKGEQWFQWDHKFSVGGGEYS